MIYLSTIKADQSLLTSTPAHASVHLCGQLQCHSHQEDGTEIIRQRDDIYN